MKYVEARKIQLFFMLSYCVRTFFSNMTSFYVREVKKFFKFDLHFLLSDLFLAGAKLVMTFIHSFRAT